MTRYGEDAIDWGMHQRAIDSSAWSGLCQSFVRQCFGLGAYFGSASEAWSGANNKHQTSQGGSVPRGVPYFWTGGSQGNGHVVLSLGGGNCLTNDFVRTGHIDIANIDAITRGWGQHPQGWSEDLNEVRIWNPRPSFDKGNVFVSKLHYGQKDSDSVRRLQHRLLNTEGVPATNVHITGYYGDGTTAAVNHWLVFVVGYDPKNVDGKSLTFAQADHLFGDNYTVKA